MKNLLTKDLWWKLFSLFLALAIWLTVHQLNEETESLPLTASGSLVTFENLPVLVISSASNVHDFRVAPSMVSVTVSGPTNVIESLEVSQVRPMVDLTDIADAKDLVRRVDVSTPPRVTLISVTPSQVGVILPPKH